jgi:hypothetical protein
VEAVVEIHERIGGPDLGADVLARHEVAATFQQDFQHLQRLAMQADFHAVLAKLARADIQFKGVEAQHAGW